MIVVAIGLFFIGIVFFSQAVLYKSSLGPSMAILILSAGFMMGGFLIIWVDLFEVPKSTGEITDILIVALPFLFFIIFNLIVGNIIYNKIHK